MNRKPDKRIRQRTPRRAIFVSVPAPIYDRLRAVAEVEDVTIAEATRMALREHFSREVA